MKLLGLLLVCIPLLFSCKKTKNDLPTALQQILAAGPCNKDCKPYFQQVEFEGRKDVYYCFRVYAILCDPIINDVYYRADGTMVDPSSELDDRIRAEGKLLDQKWYCNVKE